ncbi:helix-turn-helix domain-containing protein [Streptacidiphilus rugosus]|uniref:helix-turn-helix domain-containing protein n=1 Tax=Streptacidiphilus rugosus TaxID=405783 RepID=UPI000560017D|nr:helix-turn-helix transcriptional regulator [Streptacidiphilus rugosus]
MDLDWAHLARTFAKERRVAGMSQDDLAEALGVSRSSVQKLERESADWAKVAALQRLAATYYGWAPESIERVLAGGEPIKTEPDAGDGARPTNSPRQLAVNVIRGELAAGLSERAIDALLRGRTVDSDVIDLPTGEDTAAVLIFKRGTGDDSPERRRAELRKWARLQQAAREIFAEEDDSAV